MKYMIKKHMLHFQCTSHKLKITFTFHLFFLRNLVLTLFDINIKVLSFILLKNVGKRNYKLVKLKSYKDGEAHAGIKSL